MEAAPRHEFVSAAIFWSGECLYSLGRLDEAERAFAIVVESYPKSVKVEAASYRRELIKFEYRERELLKLLTWSHEESLRIVEDFRRRERSYEQALAAYQKQIADLKRGFPVDAEKDLADAKAQLAELNSRYAQLETQLAAEKSLRLKAEGEIATLRAQAAATPAPAAPVLTAAEGDTALLIGALEAKGRALDLLTLYLQKLSGEGK
jgi:chromosome segregation ATPase